MRAHGVLRTALVVAIASLWFTAAHGDTVTLVPILDNTLYQDNFGDFSNGAGDHFFAGRTAMNLRRRGLVAFNLTGSIEPGSVIDEVTVVLHMSKTVASAQPVGLHQVLQSWGEGVSHAPSQEGAGAPSTAGDATWVHRFYPSVAWSNAGGDFLTTASASTSVAGTGFYAWSSDGLVNDVQGWVDDPSTNHGWIVVGNETQATTAKRFDSRTNVNETFRPQLVVEFRRSTDVASNPRTPHVIRLYPNHPNPFNPGTTIAYDLGATDRVQLRVYDVSGRVVRNLVDARRNPGRHQVIWDGRDDQGRSLTSGIFFYEIRAGGFSQSRSMLLVK